MANTGNTQQQINYGAAVNDGNGDPLRTAFIKTDDNFDNVWLAGPVGSNITITNNTIQANDTNGNLILSPNGTGAIQTNSRLLPRLNNTYDFGSTTLKYRTGYFGAGGVVAEGNVTADYFVGNGSQLTGIAANYSNTNVASYLTTYTGNIAAGNIAVTNDIVVAGDVTAGVFYGTFAGNISGNLVVPGSNTWVLYNNNGNAGAESNFRYDSATDTLTVNGTANLVSINATSVAASGNITGAYILGNGSALTAVTGANVTGTVANATYATSAGTASTATTAATVTTAAQPNITSVGTMVSVSATGNITGGNIVTAGNVSGAYIFGNGSQLTGITAASSYGNANVAAYLPTYTGQLAGNQLNITRSGNTWSMIDGALNFPTGALWYSDISTNDEFISSNVDGYLNFQTFDSTSNLATELHMEHGLVHINIYNGVNRQWEFNEDGTTHFPGDLLPQANLGGNLGSSAFQWQDLWVSNNTIYINSVPLSLTAGNVLTVNGEPVLSNDSDSSISTTGNITADYFFGDGSQLTNISVAGGTKIFNGNSYANVETVDGNVTVGAAGSTWTFDTTGNLTFPAGGNTDGFNFNGTASATVALNAYSPDGNTVSIQAQGNTSTAVITTYANATATANTWTFGVDGTTALPDYTLLNPINEDLYVIAQDEEDDGWGVYNQVTDGAGNALAQTRLLRDEFKITTEVQRAVYEWTFDDFGRLNLPGNINGVYGGDTSFYAVDDGDSGSIELKTISFAGDALGSNVRVTQNNATISTNGAAYTWTYDNTGNLTLPGNTFAVNYANGTPVSISGGGANTGNVTFSDQIVIGTGDPYGGGGLYLAPGATEIGNLQYFRVSGGDNPTHLHFATGNVEYYDQYFGDDNKYLKLEAGYAGNVVIGTDDDADNRYTWTFDRDGNLTVPGNIQTITTGFAFASNISNITLSDPVTVNLTDSPFPDPVTGQVTITGVVGTTEANGTWYFQADNPDEFHLYYDAALTNPVDGTGWAAYDSGGVAVSPGFSDLVITAGNVSIVNNDGLTLSFDAAGNLTLPGNIVGTDTILIDNRATGNSADINLYSADDILLQARDRSAGSGSEGGDINIYAGDSAEDGDSSAGDVEIRGGDGGAGNLDFGGSGGTITIRSGRGGNAVGNSGGAARSGGSLTLRSGDAGDNNGNADLGEAGGDVNITAGTSTGNLDAGGSINLTTGGGGTNALAGSVYISIPVSDEGAGGDWIFSGSGQQLTVPANAEIYGPSFGNLTIGAAGNTIITTSDYIGNTYYWRFGSTGETIFPTLTVTRGDRTGTLTGSTILIGDGSQEALLSTPNGNNDAQDSQRLVINPGAGADGTSGEGGDIYLYAGRGGSGDAGNAVSGGSGGDIKIRGGLSGPDNDGGYIDIVGGEADGNGDGGNIDISGGVSGNLRGGNINIDGGQGQTNGGAVVIQGGLGIANSGGAVSITGGVSGNSSSEHGNVTITSSGSTWQFDNAGVLTVPGEGVIRSIDDTIILQSYDTLGNINYSLRLGTGGQLFLEQDTDPAWFSIVRDSGSGDAELASANGTNGGAGKNISLYAGWADQSDFYATPGGNINLTGGRGASNDGGGGGQGGSINIVAGTSADPAGIAGNVNIQTGFNTWAFDYTGNLTLPGNTFAVNYVDGNPVILPSIGNGASTVTIPITDGDVVITANASAVYTFTAAGDLALPNDLTIGTSGGAVNITARDDVNISTYGNVTIQSADGAPGSINFIGSTGDWTGQPVNNLSTITSGGGTGLTVNITESGGVATGATIATPGTGYTDGDIVVVNSGTGSATLSVNVPAGATWTFDTEGSVTLPTISLGTGLDEQTVVQSQRKIIPPFRYSAEITGNAATVVYTASSNDITSMKVTMQVQHSGLGMEFFEVFATESGNNTYYTVNNRLAPPGITASTVLVDMNGSNEMQITVTITSGAATSWVTYDAVEFGIPQD